MRRFGLIGYPLTHSFSKKYFEEKFQREGIADARYELYPLNQPDELLSLTASYSDLVGLNVTIPYKQSVIPLLNHLDDEALEIGAVNCIKVAKAGLVGYNTDAFGFECSLKNFLSAKPKQAFVLGTGGACNAVAYVLRKLGITARLVSREPASNHIAYSEVERNLKSSNLFVNTTPLGMFPQIDFAPPIPYHLLTGKDYLFDLVYNPDETLFLKKGKQAGASIKNGLEMLALQAEKSWEIWNS